MTIRDQFAPRPVTRAAPGPTREYKTSIGPGLRMVAYTCLAVLGAGIHAPGQTKAADAALVPHGGPADVATGFNVPWSAVFVGGEVLVSERDTANILVFRAGEQPRILGKVLDVTPRADGGLLGLATLEDGGRHWIYAYFSAAADNRIVRMPYEQGALGTAEVVLEGIPGGRGHNGGRIAFGPDGMLYAATGESQDEQLSQDASSLGGKILRMTPEGKVPDDNPVTGSLVYALGLRNPQGLAWDYEGRLWATDFGDDQWDELNLILPGKNYGWPVVEGRGDNPLYVDPVLQWGTQEMGPSGLSYIDGTLFVAGLTGQRLWTVSFDEAGTATPKAYYAGEYGRLRHVLKGPDGNLWIIINNTDRRDEAPREGDDRILSVPLIAAP